MAGEKELQLILRDATRLDEANTEHNRLLARLHDHVIQSGPVEALAWTGHGPAESSFDLGWGDPDRVTVAEVKSTHAMNETQQLRLGLGQVLQYRTQVAEGLQEEDERPVRAVLFISSEPADPIWGKVCRSTGVDLLWDGILDTFQP